MWTWEIPAYFFFGGMAGGSAGLAYGAHLRGDEQAARRAWLTAMAGLSVSPVLLIADLGRPERFLNMLRMFKVTSPMSVGSWVLSVTATATAVAAADALGRLIPNRAARAVIAGRSGRPPVGRARRAASRHLHRGAAGQHRGAGVARGPLDAAARLRLRGGAERRRGVHDRHPGQPRRRPPGGWR